MVVQLLYTMHFFLREIYNAILKYYIQACARKAIERITKEGNQKSQISMDLKNKLKTKLVTTTMSN